MYDTFISKIDRPEARWARGLLIVLVLGISVPYLLVALASVPGHFLAPLDDAYITYQYARQIARGYPYQYNDGDQPTTGMTSPLFGFLLAGAYWVGFTGQRLVALAVASGPVWLGLIAWLTFRLASHLTGDQTRGWGPLIAAALVVLTGSVQWSCFNGMETGLFTVLTLLALNAFVAGRTGLNALWLGLAALTRPEGLILAGLTWGVAFVQAMRTRRPDRWRGLAFLSLSVLVGLVPSLVNWILTGTTSAAGLRAKSWLLNVPFYPGDILRSILLSYQRILLGLFLGWRSPVTWFVWPGLLVFSAVGWIALIIRRRWAIGGLTLSWFLVGTLSTATLITATWHIGRYQVPFVPLLVILAVGALPHLVERIGHRWRLALSCALGGFLLISSVSSTLHMFCIYRQAIGTMAKQQLPVAYWLRENLPADVRVGVHDTGSLRYLGQRETYDLIGLTTAGATVPWRHGAGSVFETMERSPNRPDYFAIYPDVFSIPYLASTDLFAEELFRVTVQDYAVASAGPTQGVWRADWHLADSGKQFYQPDVVGLLGDLELVDVLDVADLEDEAAHNVVWWQDVRRPGFPTEVHQLVYRVVPERWALDGGRLLTGGMAFDVTTRPGKPLWIVARLHAQTEGAIRVQVNGNPAGRWSYPPVAGQWLETVFQVPAEAIVGQQTHVSLQVDVEDSAFRHYAPYYYWFLQGEVERTPAKADHPVDAVFGSRLSLVGFDLPKIAWRPGDAIPVTLYWQTGQPTQSDAKVFLHLYDAAGTLGPQSDGWAYHGTRPPYTWQPGEIVVDPQVLALPENIVPGRYSLEVGLYHPDGSGRLPAYLDGVRQAEERVPLTTIKVE